MDPQNQSSPPQIITPSTNQDQAQEKRIFIPKKIIAILIVFILIAIGGGTYYIAKLNSKPTSQPPITRATTKTPLLTTPTSSPSDLTQFSDRIFSFMYPKSYEIKSSSQEERSPFIPTYGAQSSMNLVLNPKGNQDPKLAIFVSAGYKIANKSGLTYKELLQKVVEANNSSGTKSQLAESVIGGKTAYTIISDNQQGSIELSHWYYIPFSEESLVFLMVNDKYINLQVLDQIISTFKFTQ